MVTLTTMTGDALLLVGLGQAFAAGTDIRCTQPLGQTTHRGEGGYVLPLHQGKYVPQCRAIVLCRDCYAGGMYNAWPEDCGQCAVAVAELTERIAHPPGPGAGPGAAGVILDH